MANKILAKEIAKRKKINSSNFSNLCLEVKYQRTQQSKTLKNVASDGLSQSYWSKIEHGVIVPKKDVFMEAFRRLNCDEKDIQSLISMDDAFLTDYLLAFMTKDNKKLCLVHTNCITHNNYRALFVRTLYYISTKKYSLVKNYIKSLISLIPTMADFDLAYFMLICGIYEFDIGNYNESYHNLLSVKNIVDESIINQCIQLYLFYCCYKMNSRNILYYYLEAYEALKFFGNYHFLDDINYLYACNLIYNKQYDMALNYIESINDEIKKNSCKLYLKYMKDKIQFTMNDISDVTVVFKLFIVKNVRIDLLEEYLKNYEECSDIDLNIEYFKYCLIKEPFEKYEYISNCFKNKSFFNLDGYFKEYILNEYASLSINMGQYKSFIMGYLSNIESED